MRFIPHTDADIATMLGVTGAGSLDELIAHIPANLRSSAAIRLPPGLEEAAVVAEISALAAKNRSVGGFATFLGAGYYRHYIPAAVRAIIARAEFATSYTPYQAEASQGTTQAIFEFQTMIAQLTGLEVANASMYDGASAAAEAVLMARRLLPQRNVVAVSRALWPDYRDTIETYLSPQNELEVAELPFDQASGTTMLEALERLPAERLLCTVIGYPNLFGAIEPLASFADVTHGAGGIMIAVTAEALALALLKSPGAHGADIAVGEGQSFGLPLQFGGPGLGFMATRLGNVRQMPGRLVGQTHDRDGRRAFCLTLAAREQHIRRERATSNICTNHSLCALAATVYLTVMGRRGLRELAARNVELAHVAHSTLTAAGIQSAFTAPFFNEFVVMPPDLEAALAAAETAGVIAGVPLASRFPELPEALLVSVTEMNSPMEIERLAAVLGGKH
ncbi:MAG: aminomethyl-transferring glycine dehydrogenase subunit GcvPA [Candidatus Binataceae bacterium]